MKNIITITDITKVQAGDKAYFQNCDFGFTVIDIDENDAIYTLKVDNPTYEGSTWSSSLLFDHATREVEEPEWPEDPKDKEVHWYKDSTGETIGYERQYWYMRPFTDDGVIRENAIKWYSDSLPLTEMKLVPKEEGS